MPDIRDSKIDEAALKAVSANIVCHYNIFPLKISGRSLQLATCDPLNSNLKNELELLLDNLYDI